MNGIIIFNTITGIGAFIIIAIIVIIWGLIFLKETNNRYFIFLKKYSFHTAFLLVLGGVVGSLVYSEVFKLTPCLFCWWQRIFLYPQLIVLGIGIYFKEISLWWSSIILSSIGILFSIYHILTQTGVIGPTAACDALGVSCTKIDVLIFGWITIPIMCLIVFTGILTFAFLGTRK